MTRKQSAIFLLILAAIGLLDRLVVLSGFQLKTVDADQLIYWQSARDYASGVFNEPCFYGQNYGFMVESLIAAPFVAWGAEPHIALSIVAVPLAAIPFWLAALAFWKMNAPISSAIVLLWPMILPLEYSMLVGLPRGFTAGIAIASVTLLFLQSLNKNGTLIFSNLLFTVGLIACPNSVLIVAFVGVLILWHHWKNPVLYGCLVVSLILLGAVYNGVSQFYEVNPGHLTHTVWNHYRFVWIWAAFRDAEITDKFFHLMPTRGLQALVLPAFFILGAMTLKRDRKMAAALLTVGFCAVLSFGFSRIHNGLEDLYYPISRNWLAIPVLMAVGLGWMFKFRMLGKYSATVVAGITVVALIIRFTSADVFAKHINDSYEPTIVENHSIEGLREDCEKLASVCEKTDADLVIFTFGNDGIEKTPRLPRYSCTIWHKDFPPAILESGDRLTWELAKHGNQTHERILIVGGSAEFNVPGPIRNKIIQENGPRLILISEYPGTAFELLNELGLNKSPERRVFLSNPTQ